MRIELLRAGDNPGEIVGGQPHGLGFVKFWILERGDPQQAIAQGRGQGILEI
jgi:hypothetical protein